MARLVLALVLLPVRALADPGCAADGACQADEAEISALLQSSAGARRLGAGAHRRAAVMDAWAGAGDGEYFGVAPWDVDGGLSKHTFERLYGAAALQRAKRWTRERRVLYCGNASAPDADLLGQFPFEAPITTATFWPGACPNNAKAQELFDKGLAFRFLFNDNEAACAFRGAEHEDSGCSMAALAQAYAMGPNVNYAELASGETYVKILEALQRAKDILGRPERPLQSEYAPALYGALLKFYCVDDDGALERMLAYTADEAYKVYTSQMKNCTHNWVIAISTIASMYPDDPNLQTIAAGALMQDPAWKWWGNRSVITGALANVSAAGDWKHSEGTAIKQDSAKVQPAAALANAALESALNTQPDHLGALHLTIHNLEQGPAPRWAESVADRLLKYSNHQGHAIHMQTHIATRIGNYNDSFFFNLAAVQADADWNLNRTGGGIMSMLYKYTSHNTAFAAEAAQHMGNFRSMAAAIQSLNYCASFGMKADPRMASQGNFLARQMLQPLRFGKYRELLHSLDEGSPSAPVSGMHADAKLSLHLPGMNFTIDSAIEGTTSVRNTLSDVRLFVLVVSNARVGNAAEAEESLRHLLASPATLEGCNATQETASATVTAVETLAACKYKQFLEGRDQTLLSTSSTASGTLTINNGPNVIALYVLIAAAELARARGENDHEYALLKKAFEYQKEMQYDEPAPFFYPVGETLAGHLLRDGAQESLDEAERVLRTVLFQWPRSALASLGLHSVLDRKGAEAAAVFALADATRYNDTELSLEWL